MYTSEPVRGKTYSLFAAHGVSDIFYQSVLSHLDRLLRLFPSEGQLLARLQQVSRSKRKYLYWRNSSAETRDIFSGLEQYLTGLEEHLKQRPAVSLWGGTLSTKAHQYLVYFLEFALINRINREQFLQSRFRLALLPHCIRISIPDCKARTDDLDMVCAKCSLQCYIRQISDVLEENGIHAYIWMQMNFKPTIKKLLREHHSIGILGIACIPELIAGMRKCIRYDLPVVGLPLDANRCIRWMGDFYSNSLNLKELSNLVSGSG